jgi:hypothetical protein
MSEAAARAGYGSTNAVKIALRTGGFDLHKPAGNAVFVEDSDLDKFIAQNRPVRPGRPAKSKPDHPGSK